MGREREFSASFDGFGVAGEGSPRHLSRQTPCHVNSHFHFVTTAKLYFRDVEHFLAFVGRINLKRSFVLVGWMDCSGCRARNLTEDGSRHGLETEMNAERRHQCDGSSRMRFNFQTPR